MPLKKHQEEMNQVIDGIIAGYPRFEDIKEIILSVVAGGCKGSVPVNAGKLIMAGMADAICCIIPRHSLQQQCEEVFMDNAFHHPVCRLWQRDKDITVVSIPAKFKPASLKLFIKYHIT